MHKLSKIVQAQICLQCGDKLIGRQDKKFCSDACRSTYNYTINSEQVNLVRRINNRLRKNRKILQQLNPNEKSKVHRDILLAKGFDFTYFTNVYTTKAGRTYHFCYDQGYLALDNGYYALVVRQQYVS